MDLVTTVVVYYYRYGLDHHRRRCLSRHPRFVVVHFHTMKRNNGVVVVAVVGIVVGIVYAIQSQLLAHFSPFAVLLEQQLATTKICYY
jgi:hypothetical protein